MCLSRATLRSGRPGSCWGRGQARAELGSGVLGPAELCGLSPGGPGVGIQSPLLGGRLLHPLSLRNEGCRGTFLAPRGTGAESMVTLAMESQRFHLRLWFPWLWLCPC